MTKELLKQYRELLKLELIEDLDSVIQKYREALEVYSKKNSDDMEELELIVQAFQYFTGLEGQTDVEKFQEIKMNILENLEEKEKFYNTKKVVKLSETISKKLAKYMSDGQKFEKNYEIVCQLMTTIVPIYEYEEQKVYEKSK